MGIEVKKEYKTVAVVIRLIDPKTDKEISKTTRTIDSRERRDWISKTVMYAAMNGLIAECINVKDDKDGA